MVTGVSAFCFVFFPSSSPPSLLPFSPLLPLPFFLRLFLVVLCFGVLQVIIQQMTKAWNLGPALSAFIPSGSLRDRKWLPQISQPETWRMNGEDNPGLQASWARPPCHSDQTHNYGPSRPSSSSLLPPLGSQNLWRLPRFSCPTPFGVSCDGEGRGFLLCRTYLEGFLQRPRASCGC